MVSRCSIFQIKSLRSGFKLLTYQSHQYQFKYPYFDLLIWAKSTTELLIWPLEMYVFSLSLSLSCRWAPTPWQGGWMKVIASISLRGLKTSWRPWNSLATKPLFIPLCRSSSWTHMGSWRRGLVVAPARGRITMTLTSWGSGLLQPCPHICRRKCRFSSTASAIWLRRMKNHSSSGRCESIYVLC